MSKILIILVLAFSLSGCTKSPKPQFSLYILNSLDEKELIAHFYQSTGLDDCEAIKRNWAHRKATCEIEK